MGHGKEIGHNDPTGDTTITRPNGRRLAGRRPGIWGRVIVVSNRQNPKCERRVPDNYFVVPTGQD